MPRHDPHGAENIALCYKIQQTKQTETKRCPYDMVHRNAKIGRDRRTDTVRYMYYLILYKHLMREAEKHKISPKCLKQALKERSKTDL